MKPPHLLFRRPRFRRLVGAALLLVLFAARPGTAWALGQAPYVEHTAGAGDFALAQGDKTAVIYVDTKDWPGVVRAAGDLRDDVNRVTGHTPTVVNDAKLAAPDAVIIGTVGKSALIDQLVADKKIDAGQITGKWESFFVQTVANPVPGVASALVIAGSDKRGTIYGIYDLSEQIGVSPWYFWDDVTLTHQDALFVKPGTHQQGPPAVKYRGIFFNDESPDLSGWVRATYGNAPGFPSAANFGHEFYAHAFELLLRLKGNFMWPAMWGNAFNEDDPENPKEADLYGVVMGTSHQEPMLRAQKEWDRLNMGNWSQYTSPERLPTLEQFWRDGVTRNKDYESIYTMGLRAENDSGAPVGAAVTQQVITDQRKILADVINPDLTKVPQAWCLYKEVQDYYNQGMRVPEDITLLWAEDNWGDVRRLPTAEERQRSGGAGIYYHLDYHGGPRSYQWLNTSPIAKIWDQMSLAKDYGADRIWILNVGHFKGYELPIEYFLSLAWDSKRWTSENTKEFTELWAAREFGAEHAADIADIVEKYTKYNGRRKPELVDPSTYSVVNYNESDQVVADFQAITAKAQEIQKELPENKRDAFYELVLFPTQASANVNALYNAAAKNELYAQQGRASANDYGELAQTLFAFDGQLMDYYDHTFLGGKWNHFMDEGHIGYASAATWQDPMRNSLTGIRLTPVTVPADAGLGVAVDGSEAAWPGGTGDAVLPKFDAFNQQRHYIEVFNRGQKPFAFTATASAPWISLNTTGGTVDKDQRVWVSVDWSQAPKGAATGDVKISGAGGEVTVKVDALNPTAVTRDTLTGFVEGEGVVSIEPEHYTKKTDAGANRWVRLEDYGRTLSAMRAVAPVDAPPATPGKDAPSLEYKMYLFTPGTVNTYLVLSPTLNFQPGRPLQIAVAFDDEAPQTLTIVPADFNAQNGNREWETSVKNAARFVSATSKLDQPGYHTLKVWMVDPGVAVQKIVVDMGGFKTSYLGPPESYHHDVATVAAK